MGWLFFRAPHWIAFQTHLMMCVKSWNTMATGGCALLFIVCSVLYSTRTLCPARYDVIENPAFKASPVPPFPSLSRSRSGWHGRTDRSVRVGTGATGATNARHRLSLSPGLQQRSDNQNNVGVSQARLGIQVTRLTWFQLPLCINYATKLWEEFPVKSGVKRYQK